LHSYRKRWDRERFNLLQDRLGRTLGSVNRSWQSAHFYFRPRGLLAQYAAILKMRSKASNRIPLLTVGSPTVLIHSGTAEMARSDGGGRYLRGSPTESVWSLG